ncbi:trypsin-like serine peptidase [Rhizobium ruizarguesonis]|uniref:trypsin-like serine peptidase n=1 Tax=Rhizobium ruizarguesonis TaxID=2081791 RepID=UPI0013EEADF0|nr:trypsin-like peptidase domain-containing protein [Rhizobium ruizarguesonis]
MRRSATFAVLVTLLSAALCPVPVTGQELQTNPRPALPYPPSVSVESQCGPIDDLEPVEFYAGSLGVTVDYVRQNEPSTVLFQWLSSQDIRSRLPEDLTGNIAGRRWCTGTLISESLVLTAGHCFDVQRNQNGWISPFRLGPDGQAAYEPPETLATLFTVQFGYQLSRQTSLLRTPYSFPVEQLVEFRRGGLDYAIVRLSKNGNGLEAGSIAAPATVGVTPTSAGNRLAIIQHPNGEPKMIGAGALLKASGNDLFYDDIDTLGGSSGSAIRDEQGTIAGVHTHGGCLTEATPGKINANAGVDIQAIAAVSDVF